MAVRYEVEQGDCLASIAHRFGFSDVGAIFDHPDNDDLKRRRKSPHVLAPGDVVHIPERDAPEHACATGATHRFQRRAVQTTLRLALHDAEGRPIEGKRYRVEVGGRVFQGRTGGGGVIEHPIPPDAERGALLLWPEEEDTHGVVRMSLHLGHLNPVETTTGVQQRLRNLRFGAAPVTGELDDATRRSIRRFQRKHGMRVTGEIDDALRSRLLDLSKDT